MDNNAFGLREGDAALDSPYGITPRVRLPYIGPVPSAYAPVPYVPVRLPNTLVQGMETLGRFAGAAANVLPFRPLRAIADTMQQGADVASTAQTKPTATPDLLMALLRRTESGGNYQALNREAKGNTASGAYQYTDSTWNNYGGYPKAMYAPKEVQDRRAAEDAARNLARYNGDPFKVIAHHYLPIQADHPELWDTTTVIGKHKISPVENYVRRVIRGTPLQEQFDAYLRQFKAY